MAHDRVAKRVSRGGHNIPIDIIDRRYYRGINNLLNLYIPICDNWIVTDNTGMVSKVVAKSSENLREVIINSDIWSIILKQSNDNSD
jgi:predicted ABC-type ATPase